MTHVWYTFSYRAFIDITDRSNLEQTFCTWNVTIELIAKIPTPFHLILSLVTAASDIPDKSESNDFQNTE